jgi:hypothetical protein
MFISFHDDDLVDMFGEGILSLKQVNEATSGKSLPLPRGYMDDGESIFNAIHLI